MRYVIIILCGVLLAFAAFVAIDAMSPDERRPSILNSIPNAAELKAMEAQAADACRCARKLEPNDPGRTACWSKFQASISRFPHSEMVAACMPLSPSKVCFGEGVEHCITNDYGGGACTSEEARTLEAVWGTAVRDDDPKSFELADQKMKEAVQAFIRGEKPAVSAPAGATCTG